MAENSKIEWTDHTFNGWIGCTKVGPGCDHCYAEQLATTRLGVAWGAGAPRRRTAPSTWAQPRRWNNRAVKLGIRQRVFCSSLADVFDNEVPREWREDLFELIRTTPALDWLLVTKRIGNAIPMVRRDGAIAGNGTRYLPDNVWLGATIVNQAEADRDIPKLAEAKRELGAECAFLSMEPLLGAVDLHPWLLFQPCPNSLDGLGMDPETGQYECCGKCDFTGVSDDLAVNWIIVGGESGPNARPMHPDWARSLRDQCAAAGVPFLFKQWGEWFRYGEIDADGHQNSRTRGERSGLWHEWGPGEGFSVKIGKKEAGRFLDGALHDGVPA